MNGEANKAAPPAEVPAAAELTSDDKLWGMLGHVLALIGVVGVPFGNLIGPAIVYFVRKDQSKFVRYHAIQSFAFQLLLLAAGIVLMIPTFILIAITGGRLALVLWPLFILIGLGLLVYVIMMGVKANKGELCKYPVVGAWVYKQVFERDWKPV